MITPDSTGSSPDRKPPWQSPAAAAGAMAAGLVVGRKGLVSLAVGVAAVAGAQWLLSRQKRRPVPTIAADPVSPVSVDTGVAPAILAPPASVEPPPVIASPFAQVDLKNSEDTSSVRIYEQQPDMPSRSALPASVGTVWFALFNEAPVICPDAPPSDAAHSSESVHAPSPDHQASSDLDPLPEAFFSEAPGKMNDLEESDAPNGPAYAASDISAVISEFELDRVHLVSEPSPSSSSAPAVPLPAVAEPIALVGDEGPQIVARPTSSAALPQKREAGELPKSLIVPTPQGQTSLQARKNPASANVVHRSIVPHESLTPPKAPRRWPLVAAAMVLMLAVLAVVVGTGMDGGKVNEWRLRWLNFHPDAKVQVHAPDDSFWVPDGKKTAALPSGTN